MAQLFQFNPKAADPDIASGARYDLVIVSNKVIPIMKFDASTDQACMWAFTLPRTPVGTITIVLNGIMASATSGAVRAQIQIGAYTAGDATDLDTTFDLDTADSGGASVPDTAGKPFAISITQTHVDTWTVGDTVLVILNRDADGTSGTDDATGDWYFIGGEVKDTV